jgi:phage terminase large subunit
MMNNQPLSDEQEAFARKTFIEPVLFAERVLGANLWEKEVEILESIRKNRRTAIKACHGVGKTFSLAVAALWWLTRYREGIVLTTSSTERQVKTQVWSEIRRAATHAKVPYPKLKSAELTLRDKNNYALGFSTNQTENFQGYHGKNVLIVVDEAPGIEPEFFDAIFGIMATGNVHIVIAGNPTVPAGPFFDAFNRKRALWNCITIDAFDAPNLKGITLEELLQMDPSGGGPLDQNPVPYLTTRRWVYEQYQDWWHGDETSSPTWMSRVRGQFPDQSQNALIKLSWLERARQQAIENPVKDTGRGRLIAGVDVGSGEAETVVYVCENRKGKSRIIDKGAWRAQDSRGNVLRFLEPYRNRLSAVRVDSIGVGHNFALHLQDKGLPVEFVNVCMSCDSRPEMANRNPAERFTNLKAQYYQTLADLLERDEIEGLTDETTVAQLSGLVYEIDAQGRMKIGSKEEAKAHGIVSPDRAEALMLALGKPSERVFTIYMIRDMAIKDHDLGVPIDEIVAEYDVSIEQLKRWIWEETKREGRCGRCGKPLPIDTPWICQRGLHFHTQCGKDDMFYAASGFYGNLLGLQ